MAEYLGSIDDEIQRKVDAYRNNPEVLQQRYQMNQDLLDLLALQKIKSEKEAAKQELALSMQQNPQTIRQQREAEVMGLTKDELGRQVGGIMAQRQAAQQRNIQQLAAGQPPVARTPVNTGIASQPAPNMARMAGGGIVAFAEGTKVEGEGEEARRKREATEMLASVGITPEQFARASLEEQAKIKEAINEKRGLKRVAASVAEPFASLYDFANLPFKLSADIAGTVGRATGLMGPTERFGFEERGYTPAMDFLRRNAPGQISMAQLKQALPPMDAEALGDIPVPAPAPAPAPAAASAPPAVPTGAGIGALAPQIAAQGILDTDLGKKTLAQQEGLMKYAAGQMGRDPEAEWAARQKAAEEAAAKSSTVNIFNEAMMARQQAAKERAANRGPWDWTSRLRGGGGWGDINRALASQRAATEAADMAELEKQIQLGMGKEQALRDIGKTSITAGTAAATAAEQAKTNAVTNQARIVESRFTALGIDASNRLKADIANVEAALKSEANAISRMNLNDLSETRRLNILENVEKSMATLAQKYDAALAKELEGLTLRGLKDEALKAEQKRITESWNLAKEAALKDSRRLQKQLRQSVTGGSGGMTIVGSRAG